MDDLKINITLADEEIRRQFFRVKTSRVAYLKAYQSACKYFKDMPDLQNSSPQFLQDMLMQLEMWDSGEEE